MNWMEETYQNIVHKGEFRFFPNKRLVRENSNVAYDHTLRIPKPQWPIKHEQSMSDTIKYLSGNPSVKRMNDDTNDSNILNLVDLIDHFYLDNDSHTLVTDHILDPWLCDDAMFNLNDHHRLFIPVPLNEKTDQAYRTYRDIVASTPADIDMDTRAELCAYNVWSEGMYNGQKLFRYLKKQNFKEEHISAMTTARNCSDGMFLVISNNPVDWLFMSTNQSFTSCMSLRSDYSAAFYYGIPDLICDPFKVLIYLTPGKLRTCTIKEKSFKHFRYINRSIGVITDSGDLGLVRYYPSFSIRYNEVIEKAMGIKVIENGEYWYSNPLDMTKFSLHFEDGEICEPYHDIGRKTINYKRGFANIWTNTGGTSGSRMNLNWSSGFDDATCYDDICGGTDICQRCDGRIQVDNGYYVEGALWCEHCADDYSIYCDHCNERYREENCSYIESEDQYYCLHCRSRYTDNCPDCGDNFVSSYGFYLSADAETICSSCAEGEIFYCDLCGEWNRYEHAADLGSYDAHTYCEECFEGMLVNYRNYTGRITEISAEISTLENSLTDARNTLQLYQQRIERLVRRHNLKEILEARGEAEDSLTTEEV